MKIGLTGGIGAGKSTVSRIFQVFGVPVFNADQEARFLMEHNLRLRESLLACFGKQVFTQGVLNRKWLAHRVFADAQALKQLNHLVHPVLFDAFLSWADQQDAQLLMMEAAILFEAGADQLVDLVVAVTASEKNRTMRVIQRDHVSAEAVQDRMQHQMNQTDMNAHSDFVIDNNGIHLLVPQAWKVFLSCKAMEQDLQD